MAGFFRNMVAWVMGEGLKDAMNGIKEKISETIEEMEARIEKATIKVVKTTVLFLMISVGVIFMLVGLSIFLNETVPKLAHGLGTVLVGAVLVLLALFARMMK